jgi:integrase
VASIRRKKGKRRTTYEVRVGRGDSRVSKTFPSRAEAEQFAALTEAEMRRGVWRDPTKCNMTLASALERYAREYSVHKAHQRQELARIAAWRQHRLASKPLTEISRADLRNYALERKAALRGTNTIRLELALISNLFTVARRDWEEPILDNPASGVLASARLKLPQSVGRRIALGEVRRLLRATEAGPCAGQGAQSRLRAALVFSLRTGLRRGELVNLKWSNVHLSAEPAYVVVRDKDASLERSRQVVLCARSVRVLRALQATEAPDAPVFGYSYNGLGLAWSRLKKRAAVTAVRWHDTRHSAASRYFDRGLSLPEVMSQTGHRTAQVALRYAHSDLNLVASKLS